MGSIIGIISFLVFVAIWYLPLFVKHRKVVSEPKKYYLQAFLMGIVAMIVATIVEIAITCLIGLTLRSVIASSSVLKFIYHIFDYLIAVALVEEGFKLLMGRRVLKKVPELTEAGSMLIMGMTGLGFEFMESLFQATDFVTAALRGVTDLHLFFQMWMGIYIWRAWEARKQGNNAGYKKNMRIAIVVPVIIHFLFDWTLEVGVSAENDDIGIFMVLFGLITAIAFIIIGLLKAYKTVKKERIEAEATN